MTARPSARRALLVLLVPAVAALAAIAPSSGQAAGGSLASDAVVPTLPSQPLPSTSNPWRAAVTKASVAKSSTALVASLTQQVADKWGGVAAFNDSQYSVAFYQVGASVPRVNVSWDNCQGSSDVPPQLYDPSFGAHFVNVPIPSDAVPASGSDGVLSIYSPSTDQLWDLWKAHQVDGDWHACWGGRIDDWSTSQGYFPLYTGASASGMAVEAGTISLADVASGTIDHAIDLTVTDTASSWSWPAQRSDGQGTDAGAIPMGTRFRLSSSVDVDSLGLTPIGRMVAKAAQKYGFIVGDSSYGVAIAAERGRPHADGSSDWDAARQGVPSYQVLAGFPWSKLQALPAGWGKPTS